VLNEVLALADSAGTEIARTAPSSGEQMFVLALAALEVAAKPGKPMNEQVEPSRVCMDKQLIAGSIGEKTKDVLRRLIFDVLLGHTRLPPNENKMSDSECFRSSLHRVVRPSFFGRDLVHGGQS
jgi:hypothetical protein